MPKTDVITQARLKELLHYNPETGIFIRLTGGHGRKKGDIAGCHDNKLYVCIQIDSVKHKAHRLAFLYMLGWMPEQVDHDDQVHDNNRWSNLNSATSSTNQKNTPLQKNNTSGTTGVVWHKGTKKWHAKVQVKKKKVHLGYFTHKPDAIAARQAADIQYDFHTNHGK